MGLSHVEGFLVKSAGTLSDFLKDDLSRKYPDLIPYVRVTLLQSAQSILTTVSGTRLISNVRKNTVVVPQSQTVRWMHLAP